MVANNPRGFVCPQCGTKLLVIRTRRRAKGVVSRRRQCPTCGHRATTEERPAPDLTRGTEVAPGLGNPGANEVVTEPRVDKIT